MDGGLVGSGRVCRAQRHGKVLAKGVFAVSANDIWPPLKCWARDQDCTLHNGSTWKTKPWTNSDVRLWRVLPTQAVRRHRRPFFVGVRNPTFLNMGGLRTLSGLTSCTRLIWGSKQIIAVAFVRSPYIQDPTIPTINPLEANYHVQYRPLRTDSGCGSFKNTSIIIFNIL